MFRPKGWFVRDLLGISDPSLKIIIICFIIFIILLVTGKLK